jgi:hypothetical protein
MGDMQDAYAILVGRHHLGNLWVEEPLNYI